MQTLRLVMDYKSKDRINEFIDYLLGTPTSFTRDQFKWDDNELQLTATPTELYRFGYDWMIYQIRKGWAIIERDADTVDVHS